MATHAPRYSSLDLPRPFRAAWPLLALATVALLLEAAPELSPLVGLAGAACFAVAAAVRAELAQHELAAVRRAADRLIVREPHGGDASELIRWRSAELTAPEARAGLRREYERLVRRLDPVRLPSASPLRRVAARRHEELLRAVAERVGDEQPVAARGILLARDLLRNPASPLYADDAEALLARGLTRVLEALEP